MSLRVLAVHAFSCLLRVPPQAVPPHATRCAGDGHFDGPQFGPVGDRPAMNVFAVSFAGQTYTLLVGMHLEEFWAVNFWK